MKFEILFNEHLYRKQTNILFELVYKDQLKRFNRAGIFGAVLIIIGYLVVVFGKMNLGYFIIVAGGAAAISYYVSFYKYKLRHKAYLTDFEAQIPGYLQNPVSHWEFNNIYFKFSDYSGEYCFPWRDIPGYLVTNDILILFANGNMPFFLDEAEIGTETYHSVLKLVEDKIKQ